MGFSMSSTHAQCIDYVMFLVLAVTVLVYIRSVMVFQGDNKKYFTSINTETHYGIPLVGLHEANS